MQKMRPFMSNQGLEPEVNDEGPREVSSFTTTYDISGLKFTTDSPVIILDEKGEDIEVTAILDPSYIKIGDKSYPIPSTINGIPFEIQSDGDKIQIKYEGDFTIEEGFISISYSK